MSDSDALSMTIVDWASLSLRAMYVSLRDDVSQSTNEGAGCAMLHGVLLAFAACETYPCPVRLPRLRGGSYRHRHRRFVGDDLRGLLHIRIFRRFGGLRALVLRHAALFRVETVVALG